MPKHLDYVAEISAGPIERIIKWYT